jgi:hypothetical protein
MNHMSGGAFGQRRLQAYFERHNTHPLVGFFVGSYYPLHRYRAATTLPEGAFEPSDIHIDAYLADYDRLHTLHAACRSDLPWTATAFWGVPWLEAALGCRVEASHCTGSSRSRRLEGDGWPKVPQFSLDNPWVACCMEMLRAIAAHAAGRYPLGATLMRGVSDLLSALLGSDRMIYAMLDDPVRVHTLAEQITEFWIAFGHAQLDAIPSFAGGYGSFFYNLWAPGRCLWLQEDAAALLSPKLFEEFILPYDRHIAAAFEYTFVHLHPARYTPYRLLLDSDLSVIELHIDKSGPSVWELLPIYREVLACKPLYVWGDISEDGLGTLLNELDPAGLAIGIVVESPFQARALYERHLA